MVVPPPLSEDERAALLALARAALRAALDGEAAPTPDSLGVRASPRLDAPGGAFVTLRHAGTLRGCIGEIRPTRPLWQVVVQMAAGAGTRDHRFAPVRRSEVDALDLHVSVLTPPRPVAAWDEIEIGRHGIILERDGRSAVFLPEVAPDQGWDLHATLTHLCAKAGLPGEAWRTGARFLVFEAEGFTQCAFET